MQDKIDEILKMSKFIRQCEDDNFLFANINDLKNNKAYLKQLRKELINEYKIGSGSGSAKLIQLVVTAILDSDKNVTPELIDKLKLDYKKNKDFCKNYLTDSEYNQIKNTGKYNTNSANPFKNWKKNINILRRLLYPKTDFDNVNINLKNIASNIINSFGVFSSLYKYSNQGFLGNQGYGRQDPVIMIYNKNFTKHSEAVQLSLYFDDLVYAKIEYGDDIRKNRTKTIKEIINTANYEELKSAIKKDLSFYISAGNKELKIENTEEDNMPKTISKNLQPLNQILYGPPGTGKTYNTVVKAMEIIDDKKYTDDKGNLLKEYNYENLKIEFNKRKEQGQIQFITFHQSYSYEEFVEGIKPYIPEWGENFVQDVKYVGKDGIFKNICNIASSYSYFENDLFEKAYNEYIKKNKDKDNILLMTPIGAKFAVRINKNLSSTIITGKNLDQETSGSITKEQIKYQTYTSIGRKGYMEGLTNYICKEYNLEQKKQKNNNLNYVLIIDEINRGNISKIFGELITLIEDDKRECVNGVEPEKYNTITVTLPYSGESFSVPNNLYIIGTMNTADRSIALLDTALRRRFDFVEMMPQENLINGTLSDELKKNYDLSTFLENLNKKISSKLDDDNYKIGHAYLMNLKSENDLERAICNKIFPLLQEYFYNEKKDLKDIVGFCSLSELKENKNWKKFIDRYSKQEDNSD